MGKRLKKIDLIQKKLEDVGLFVERDDDDINPMLTVKRKATSKRPLFELVFEKGKLRDLVAGNKSTCAAWISLKK